MPTSAVSPRSVAKKNVAGCYRLLESAVYTYSTFVYTGSQIKAKQNLQLSSYKTTVSSNLSQWLMKIVLHPWSVSQNDCVKLNSWSHATQTIPGLSRHSQIFCDRCSILFEGWRLLEDFKRSPPVICILCHPHKVMRSKLLSQPWNCFLVCKCTVFISICRKMRTYPPHPLTSPSY